MFAGAREMISGASIEEVPVSATGHQSETTRSIRGTRTLVVLLTLLALAVCAAGGLWAAPAQAATVDYSPEELAFFTLVNNYRVANGVAPLLLSDTLALSAERHSSDMGKYRFFDHQTKGQTGSPWATGPGTG